MRGSVLLLAALLGLLCFCPGSYAYLPNSRAIPTGSYGLNPSLGLVQISIPPPTNSPTSVVLYIFDTVLNSTDGNNANGYVDIMAYTPKVSKVIDEMMEKPKSRLAKQKAAKVWEIVKTTDPKDLEQVLEYYPREKKTITVVEDGREFEVHSHNVGTPAPPPVPYSIDRVSFSVRLTCGTPYDPRISSEQLGCTQLTSYANLDYCESNFMVMATSSGPMTRNIGYAGNSTVVFSLYSFLGGSWSYNYQCLSGCDSTFGSVCNLPTA